jgi:uncharacterized membrane protein
VHLRLFRLIQKYDQGLIHRNLHFLFFIVLFPFTASGMFGHLQEGFVLPLYIYLGNLVLVSGANFRLCRYVFYQKPYLSVKGETEAKRYFYYRSLYTLFAMLGMLAVVVIVALIVPRNLELIGCSSSAGAVFLAIASRKAGKLRPAGYV